jgi:hypothetical protein
MSTDRPEFRPVDAAPKRSAWPFAVMGAAIVALVILLVQREGGRPLKPVALGNVPAKADPKAVVGALADAAEAGKAALRSELAKTAAPAPAPARAEARPETASAGPNVLGGQPARAKAMVAASELERERARTRGAQKAAASYKKQVDELTQKLEQARGELLRARGQLAAVQNPPRPPPTDQEQILRTLAPVLQANGDGRN